MRFFRKPSLLPWLIASTTAVADANHNNKDGNDKDRPRPRPPPNIVLVVIDDLGSNDLGWHGSGIHTPTMDGLLLLLSDEAIWLSNYYVLPYCSPTRAALLTGRYPLHTGCHDIIRSMSTDGLPLDEITLPQMLRTNHYRTHAVGKWHLGHSRWTQTPTFRGFESFFGYYLGWSDYYTHYTGCDDGVGYDLHWDDREFCGLNCSQYPDERGHYSTHVFTDRAVQVIQNHQQHHQQAAATNANANATSSSTTTSPLFLYLAYQGVHAPNEVPLIYSDRYRHNENWTNERQLYAGMLTAVDEGIGNVTRALRKAGMWDDTVLIITTDNGGPTKVCSVQGSSNRGRGGKCTVWEGGTVGDALVHFGRRTTAVARRGGRKRRRSSTTTNATAAAAPVATTAVNNNRTNNNNNHNTTITYPHLFHVVDWFPTLARLAQVVIPNDNGKPLDGVDQLDGLLGLMYDDSSSTVTTTMTTSPSQRPIRQEVFVGYAALDGNWYGPAMRYGNYKLLQGAAGGGPEDRHRIPPGPDRPAPPGGGDSNTTTYYRLYNVHVDPYETVDLALTYPLLVDILRAKLREYQKSYVPPILPDLECGRFAGLVEHMHYGRVWTPWCEKLVVYE
jgi:arylsulfatase A-like enzyme